jgi:hypothetical protein
MNLFQQSFKNLLKNILIYNTQRLDSFIKNELELQIEYIYISEYKKHFFVLDVSDLKNHSHEIYNLIVSEYNQTKDINKLIDFIEKIK